MFLRNKKGGAGEVITAMVTVLMILIVLMLGFDVAVIFLAHQVAINDARDIANDIQSEYTWNGSIKDLEKESGLGARLIIHNVCWGPVNGDTLGDCGTSPLTGESGKAFYVRITWSTRPIGLPFFPRTNHATHIARGTLQVPAR